MHVCMHVCVCACMCVQWFKLFYWALSTILLLVNIIKYEDWVTLLISHWEEQSTTYVMLNTQEPPTSRNSNDRPSNLPLLMREPEEHAEIWVLSTVRTRAAPGSLSIIRLVDGPWLCKHYNYANEQPLLVLFFFFSTRTFFSYSSSWIKSKSTISFLLFSSFVLYSHIATICKQTVHNGRSYSEQYYPQKIRLLC